MEIAIGLLAHNEERRIGKTLRSLFRQTVFRRDCRERLGVTRIQVACVPNGCSDGTAAEMRNLAIGLGRDDAISFECHELPEPGKSRAWNAFVHSISAADVRYLLLVDADIEFGSSDVLEQIVAYMEANPEVVVGTDRPIKLTANKPCPSVQEKLSLAASNQVDTEGKISGQLYCGRSKSLRRIWMPVNLPVEDGFLAAMIVTDGFTRRGVPGAIVQVPEVFHYYEVHKTVSQFIRHETRIVVGSTINSLLFGLLWEEGKSGHVGAFIRRSNEQDAGWLEQLVKARTSKTRWLIPRDFVLKRLRNLKGKRWSSTLAMLPIAFGATVLQALVCVRANSILRREGSTRLW
jgi:glycosyltransferase involved in cell wall biosynthesis